MCLHSWACTTYSFNVKTIKIGSPVYKILRRYRKIDDAYILNTLLNTHSHIVNVTLIVFMIL